MPNPAFKGGESVKVELLKAKTCQNGAFKGKNVQNGAFKGRKRVKVQILKVKACQNAKWSFLKVENVKMLVLNV